MNVLVLLYTMREPRLARAILTGDIGSTMMTRRATGGMALSEQAGEGKVVLEPIGLVVSGRKRVEDDYWGSVVSVIQLSDRFTNDVTAGLMEFSHLEVIYFLNQVSAAAIETRARHPRNNPSWPLVGIFAQRPKARPNLLGLSRCRLLQVEGLTITVEALDAVEGSPVLDIKPYMREYGPIGEVRQPEWATDVMKNYYRKSPAAAADANT